MCGNLHDITFSTFKKLARMRSTLSTPSTTKRTRKTSAMFGLGEGSQKLMPQLLALDRHHHTKSFGVCCIVINKIYLKAKTRTQAAKQVFAQVSIFYKKANIHMRSEIKACQKMLTVRQQC